MNLVLTEQPIPHLTYALPKLLGATRAADMIFTARRVGAAEAERIGLVSEPATAPSARGRRGPAGGMRTQEFIASLVPKIMRLPQPVIAAVNVDAAVALENRAQILSGEQILATTGKTFADTAAIRK